MILKFIFFHGCFRTFFGNIRLVFLFLFLHQRTVLQMFLKFFFPLNSRVPNFADFLRIKFWPFLIVEFFAKRQNRCQISEIDKRIANIAVVLEINWKVEEIVLVLKFLIKQLKHQVFGVLVGYVPDHQCSFLAFVNFAWNYIKIFIVFNWLISPLPLFQVIWAIFTVIQSRIN